MFVKDPYMVWNSMVLKYIEGAKPQNDMVFTYNYYLIRMSSSERYEILISMHLFALIYSL